MGIKGPRPAKGHDIRAKGGATAHPIKLDTTQTYQIQRSLPSLSLSSVHHCHYVLFSTPLHLMLKTDWHCHSTRHYLIFVFVLNIKTFSHSKQAIWNKTCPDHILHTLSNIIFSLALCSARGPLALYTSVWVMCEAGLNTHVNQPWFTIIADHPKQTNGHSPFFLSYFYISPTDRLPPSFHKDI